MNTSDLTTYAVYLIIGIVVLFVLGSLQKNRFTKTTHKDKFRSKKEIGSQNIRTPNKSKTYTQVAKERNLAEAKHIERKVDPKVTRFYATTSKDIKDNKE